MNLIQVNGWNAYVHLPSDYDQTTKNYPTIIFIPGLGEVGTDPNRLIQNGPGAYLKQGWNGEALGIKFIVISLQPPAAWPNSYSIKQRVDELSKLYRIGDLYMTGLSMGVWAVLSYSHEYPTEPKAVVSVEGVIPSAGYNSGDGPWADYIQKYYEAPIKAGQRYVIFEQKNDLRGGSQVIVAANYWKPGSGNYILTNFGGGGHCCWNEFYGGQGKQPGIFNIDGINQNIYEWMALETLKVLPDFLHDVKVKGNMLTWSCENIEDGDYFVIEGSKDYINFTRMERIAAKVYKNDYSFQIK